MPLQTFLNLPNNRREEIINICFEEFAVNDFDSASLSNIIKKAGVAKGSFYRYFENKERLYQYLHELSRNLMESEFKNNMHKTQSDFISNWTEYLIALKKIEDKYPMLIKFQLKSAADINVNGKKGNTEKRLKNKIGYFNNILEAHIGKEEIRDDISLEILSTVIVYVQLGILGYLQLQSSMKETDETKVTPIFGLSEKETKDILEQFMKIVYAGIRKK